MLREPVVAFSPWHPWNRRHDLKTADNLPWGGVYLLAHFASVPGPTEVPWPDLPKEIVYVGSTKNLNDRPLTTHNRIPRYVKLFGDPTLERLCVSVFPVFCTGGRDEKLLRSYIQYLEAKLDWDYTRKYEKRPAMHFKEKAGS